METGKSIRILYANVRGLRSKVDSLHAVTQDYNPDVILLTETQLTGKTTIEIKDYKEVIYRNRKQKGGGLLVAIKDESNIKAITVEISEAYEQIWVKIDDITIALVYGLIETRAEEKEVLEWYYTLEKEYTKWQENKVHQVVNLVCLLKMCVSADRCYNFYNLNFP